MALKGDRHIITTDITFTLSDVASKGQFVCYKTAGSGASMGLTRGAAQVAANPSGLVPLGLLLNDFVNIDETVRHRNYQKDEHVIGDPATVLRKGWVVTDKVIGSPTVGQKAYLTSSGNVMATNQGLAATPLVGEFMSIKDESGFIRLMVELP